MLAWIIMVSVALTLIWIVSMCVKPLPKLPPANKNHISALEEAVKRQDENNWSGLSDSPDTEPESFEVVWLDSATPVHIYRVTPESRRLTVPNQDLEDQINQAVREYNSAHGTHVTELDT